MLSLQIKIKATKHADRKHRTIPYILQFKYVDSFLLKKIL